MYELVTDLNQVRQAIDADAYLYLDTETEGDLYGKIRLVQMYQSSWDKVLIVDIHNHDIREVFDIIKDKQTIWHNFHYDASCFRKMIKGATFSNWEDTFLSGRLVFPHLDSFSLDTFLTAVHKRDPYMEAGLDKKEMQKSNWGGLLINKHYTYAALDVYKLPKLWEACICKQEDVSYVLDKKTVELMLIYQETGLPVSKAKLFETKREAENLIREYQAKLPKGFNVNSYKQVRAYLGMDESDDLALAALIAKGDERADWVRQCKKQIKRISFIDKFKSADGRIYGHFNVATRSGRSNCDKQNLQQLPSSLKHTFETEKFFVYADFSNLELRTFAAVTGEPIMVQKFKEDADLHKYSASRLFNVPEDEVVKTQRQIAKIWNFSSLYGAGVNTRISILLKYTGILIDEAEGRRLAKAWLNTYPGVKPWQDENAAKWRRGEVGYTALGRPYLADLFTDQNNIQIQGSGSEVAKLAKLYMSKQLDIRKLCVFVHDSYTFEFDTLEEAKAGAKIVAESMYEAWQEMSPNFVVKDLPMPVDAVVAHNWYDCQEDKNLLYKYSISYQGERSES